ncbi:uncharacterized protein BDR25DRAFT_276744 [Lindgomyces ingoldianus]|uniref:Uncharacterized protein n=1 Tax=Lindgomyces ingoldianus TaxID=673940 RepID=A0ACB6REB2_9PLEO|nr:uncharacterized protein BDR25DRAFT_276744 [Lindgomyces ingoldianus]KAF2477055.1 hypothetical protein BDR25DRAFT_276744 [Lindgomyces ingoldianus]
MSTCKTLARICSKTSRPYPLPLIQCRHESSTRRHKKLLHLPEAPSYTPDSSAPTLVFNPPSSAPNVYHTPLKFLPQNDRRRQLYSDALTVSTHSALRKKASSVAQPGTPLATSSLLPPIPSVSLPSPVRQPYNKKYHLTEEDIEEIRKLRTKNPNTWTRVKLAEKFGCSQFFVSMVVKAPEKAERVSAEHQQARERWGPRRRMAREDRARRKEMWGRDE